jgi:prophage tail gpP-like protein
MRSEELRIVIGGVELTGWTGATIEMHIDQLADAFSVSAPFDPSDKVLSSIFKPYAYQAVELYIGPDIALKGRLDSIATSLTPEGRLLTIQGRSSTAQLIDCSIDGPLEFYAQPLSALARQVCQPFGIGVRADGDTEAVDVARGEYGQSPIDFLNAIARPRNLYFGSAFDGRLVIWPGSSLNSAPVRARLVEGEAPVLSVTASFDGTGRFSIYKAAAQFAGEPDLVGVARDPSIQVFRPILSTINDCDNDPDVTARKLRSEAIARSFVASVTLSGWRRPGGELWSERQIVTLKAPGALLKTEMRYVIANVTQSLTTGEKTTTLQLAPIAAYSGAGMEGTPWA